MTSHGQAIRRRRTHRGFPAVGVVVGIAAGFAMGAVAEVLLMGGGWYSVVENVLYPLAFMFALVGAFSGGFTACGGTRRGPVARLACFRSFHHMHGFRRVAFLGGGVSRVWTGLLFWLLVICAV